MSALENGGPAFPRTGDTDPRMADYDQSDWHSGMSLRDWFAGQALAGWIAGPCQGDSLDEYEGFHAEFAEHQQQVAKTCYGYADAMLEERSKP